MRAAKGTLAAIGATALSAVATALGVAAAPGPATALAVSGAPGVTVDTATGPAARASTSAAEAPTREEYVATVEPICKRNTLANKRILRGARQRVNSGRLKAAGRQFIRAAAKFRATVGKIAAVPRPPADEARLLKWFRFLKIVAEKLRKVGKALKEGDRIKAVHERIRVERASNAANNVGFVFGFRECRIVPSRFT